MSPEMLNRTQQRMIAMRRRGTARGWIRRTSERSGKRRWISHDDDDRPPLRILTYTVYVDQRVPIATHYLAEEMFAIDPDTCDFDSLLRHEQYMRIT